MKDNEELEMLLNVEIPQSLNQNLFQQEQRVDYLQQCLLHDYSPNQGIPGMFGMYEDDPSLHYKYLNASSPVSGLALQSEGSYSSSPFVGSPLFHEVLAVFHEVFPYFEDTKPQTPYINTHYSNGLGNDELLLSGSLSRMNIRDVQDDLTFNGQFPNYGLQFSDRFSERTNNGNADNRRFQSSCLMNAMNYGEERKSLLSEIQEMGQIGGLPKGYISHYNSRFPHLDGYTCSTSTPLKQPMEDFRSDMQFLAEIASFRNCDNLRIQVPNSDPLITSSSLGNGFLCSLQNGRDCNEDRGVLDSPSSPQLTNANPSLGFDGRLLHSSPISIRRPGITPNGRILNSSFSAIGPRGLEACSFDDSLIIQEKCSNHVYNKSCDCSREHNKHSCNEICPGHPIEKSSELDCISRSISIPSVDCNVQGCIYCLAKDQQGCRFLQQKLDKRSPQYVQMIFNGIICHVSELMMDPFGNYLMQKLLDVCTDNQRKIILLMVTSKPGQLVRISLNSHGTRVVQKLIETLKTRHQILLVTSSLKLGILDLIKDPNGIHVLQTCLHNLSSEDNEFIYNAATEFCVDIATHQHGCCVLQRCIDHSIGEQRENLVAEIAANGLSLAQNAYGNYVVQYVIEQKIPSATKTLISQFEGNYVNLSMQKFSSNVVEKCLKEFCEVNKLKIIYELLSDPRFEQLLQHQFANYVVQTALVVSKGVVYASLVGVILPHEERLRTSPYSKRLFSRSRLAK